MSIEFLITFIAGALFTLGAQIVAAMFREEKE